MNWEEAAQMSPTSVGPSVSSPRSPMNWEKAALEFFDCYWETLEHSDDFAEFCQAFEDAFRLYQSVCASFEVTPKVNLKRSREENTTTNNTKKTKV